MNTKEAIEVLQYIITIASERYNEDSINKKDDKKQIRYVYKYRVKPNFDFI